MRRAILTVIILILAVSTAVGQEAGQINGVIADSSGGVIPGVSVTAVERGTGISRDTVTGANGRYSFVAMRPTTYEIRAELTGFRTVRRTDVVLQANQNLTLNITLELGELSETVTVAGQAATVDISSATIAEVVDSKRIVELPLNGRDAARLSMLVSGMVVTEVDRESGKTIPGALALSTNGTQTRQASFKLDGTNHTDMYFSQNQPFPFPDALQEFSIQSSNYSASQGASAGAVVNAVTRSGTNNFHGGVFGYARDRTFNSKNFFLPERDFLKRKQYGGYAGGPIMQNKLFFFVGWQGTTIQNVGGTLNNFVPSDRMRAGDFSEITTQLRDPNGGIFPGNQIPAGRFDPASLKVLGFLPHAPSIATSVQVPRRIGQDDNQVIMKVDNQLTQNNQVSARYFFDHFTNDPTFNEGNLLSYRGPTLGSRQRIQNITGSWQRTMTSTLLNEFRVGFNKFASSRYPPSNGVPSMKDLGVRLPIYPTLPSISQIEANGFFGIGDNLFASFPRHGIEVNDRVNWAKGKHQIQFGGEGQFHDVKIRNEYRRAGHNVFRSSATAGTGHALSDFMLGILDSFDQGTGEYKDYKVFYASAFFQDDYKVSDTVTLNLGVRYEHSPPWHEVVGRVMHWSVADYDANVRSTQFPQAPRGETFRGDPGFVGEEGVEPSPDTASARFGFAWDITGDGRTSLRGGGGSFYDQRRDGGSGNGSVNAPPWSLRLAVTRPQGPFSNPYLGRNDFDLITDATVGTKQAVFPTPVLMETFGDEYKVPVTYNFNLTFEREVVTGLMARAAYVGSRNRNGRTSLQLNYADKNIPGATTGNTDARRLYASDGIGDVSVNLQTRESNYNSLQLTLSKRYSHGYTVTSNYTLSKVEGDFGDQVIPYTMPQDRSLLWGPLEQDHRHRFTTSWVVDLPGGNMEGPMKWVVGGWQWTGVMQFQTGRPFNITSGQDNSLDGIGNDRAKLTGVSLDPPQGSPRTVWFNPAAFARNDIGTFGDVPKGYLYGPSLHSWDMGLFKNFRMSSDMNIQFRAEFFNIFNRVNFDNPNSNASGGGFGTITRTDQSFGDPRILQFGLKFVF
jgi:Carboxypeptidase regulatory-like domain